MNEHLNYKYQKNIITISLDFFESTNTLKFLTQLAGSGKLIYDSFKDRNYKTNIKRVFKFEFLSTENYCFNSFQKNLGRIFNSNFLEFKVSASPQFKNEIELLEYLCEKHDRYYEFSDDHRVYASGETSRQRILKMGEELKSKFPDDVKRCYGKAFGAQE